MVCIRNVKGVAPDQNAFSRVCIHRLIHDVQHMICFYSTVRRIVSKLFTFHFS